jgi:MOSC domain-containing protein YiiM
MQVVSTNRGAPTSLEWKGNPVISGIYKRPEHDGIYLTRSGVRNDTVGNPEVHGGQFKACYLFDADTYAYWKSEYPNLNWQFGMFGENLSVSGLDEGKLIIGSEYAVGQAIVRITTPREPCFKLGIRFEDQGIIEKFIAYARPGTYVEVLQDGLIKAGDELKLLNQPHSKVSVIQYFRMLFENEKDPEILKQALSWPFINGKTRDMLNRWNRP